MKKKNKPKQKRCKFCGSLFAPYTSLDKFCSSNCRIENQKSTRAFRWNPESTNKRVGKNNPSYRNGTYCRNTKRSSIGEREFIKQSKAIRGDMVSDVGYIYCENCNTSNSIKFECHHLIFRSEKPLHESLHKRVNLILLCIQCHNDFHKTKSLRNDIVNDRKLGLLFGNDVLNK